MIAETNRLTLAINRIGAIAIPVFSVTVWMRSRAGMNAVKARDFSHERVLIDAESFLIRLSHREGGLKLPAIEHVFVAVVTKTVPRKSYNRSALQRI
jgi:hypothetical protein